MTEYVQVPVSLIERARQFIIDGFKGNVVEDIEPLIDDLADALSQPTPTAESPRIEDMAPGTTFIEEVRWTITGTLSTGSTVAHSSSGEMRFADRFDPSTIRDVTPPEDAA